MIAAEPVQQTGQKNDGLQEFSRVLFWYHIIVRSRKDSKLRYFYLELSYRPAILHIGSTAAETLIKFQSDAMI